ASQISESALHSSVQVFVKSWRDIVDTWYSESYLDINYAEESFHVTQSQLALMVMLLIL
ncbi:hypothetical protein H4Q26_005722, partial [Puccinia striiformis f. sp. tritici PST-130]